MYMYVYASGTMAFLGMWDHDIGLYGFRILGGSLDQKRMVQASGLQIQASGLRRFACLQVRGESAGQILICNESEDVPTPIPN